MSLPSHERTPWVRPVVLCLAVLQLTVSLAFLGRGPEYIVTALTIDDTYYYLQTAWNVSRSGFVTFDGVHSTNGVQLAWFWLLAALGRLAPTKGALLTAALAAGAMANAACHLLFLRLARGLTGARGRTSLALGCSALWLLQSLGSVAYSRGLESSLHALVFLLLIDQATRLLAETDPGADRRARLLAVTALAVVNAWCRLDAGIFSAAIYGACVLAIWRGRESASRWGRDGATLLLSAGVASAGLCVQLVTFRWMGGSWLPVSALVKRELQTGAFWDPATLAEVVRLGLPAGVPPGASVLAVAAWLWLRRSEAPRTGMDRAWGRLWWVLLLASVAHVAVIARGGAYWYLAPEALFWNLTLAGIASRIGSKVARALGLRRLETAAAWAGLAAAVAVTAVLVAGRWEQGPNLYTLRYRVALRLESDLPEGSRVASWNSGQLGYFAGLPVTNLDGLVNSADYFRRVIEPGRPIGDYLRREGITHIVDRSDLGSHGNFRDHDLLPTLRLERSYSLPGAPGTPEIRVWRTGVPIPSAGG